MHRVRGFGPKEVLLAVCVVLATVAILFPLWSKIQKKDLLLTETGKMRRVYVALFFYEEQYDTKPAPDLLDAALYNPTREDFISDLDPFGHGGSNLSGDRFPLDPGLENNEHSLYRISFSYIQNFIRNKKISVKPWVETRQNPLIGELANEWYGSVQPGEPFRAQVSGRLMRVNTDGSVTILKDRGGPKALGNSEDLFLKLEK